MEFTKSTILIPDVNGQTTIHAAVKACFPKVTSILLAGAEPKGLQMENTVGDTLLDIVSLSELNSRTERFWENQGCVIDELWMYGVNPFRRHSEAYVQKLEKELPQMHAVLDTLFTDGRLKSQTKLATELTKFCNKMSELLSAAALVPTKEKASENKDPLDTSDINETRSVVVAALKDLTVNRQLVHLIDVQKSVGADLEKAGESRSDNWRTRRKDEDELEAERDEDEKESQSMVYEQTLLLPDSI